MKFKNINKREFAKLFLVTLNEDLAIKYDVKPSTIRTWGAKLGLNKKTWLWSRNDENYVLKHYGKDRTISEICEKINRSKWAVINKYRTLANKRKNNQYKYDKKRSV